MLAATLIVVGSYLLGSVSFAVVVSRAFDLPDPHEYGSGQSGRNQTSCEPATKRPPCSRC